MAKIRSMIFIEHLHLMYSKTNLLKMEMSSEAYPPKKLKRSGPPPPAIEVFSFVGRTPHSTGR